MDGDDGAPCEEEEEDELFSGLPALPQKSIQCLCRSRSTANGLASRPFEWPRLEHHMRTVLSSEALANMCGYRLFQATQLTERV